MKIRKELIYVFALGLILLFLTIFFSENINFSPKENINENKFITSTLRQQNTKVINYLESLGGQKASLQEHINILYD